MDLKTDVQVGGVRSELLLGLMVVEGVFRARGIPCTVTAVRDGKHKVGSLHYVGAAADIRLPSRYAAHHAHIDQIVTGEIRAAIGPDYDVLLEPDHLHLEWDPKRPTPTLPAS